MYDKEYCVVFMLLVCYFFLFFFVCDIVMKQVFFFILDELLIDKVVDEVVKDRFSVIEVCFVKIMKEKKVLQFRQLIVECVEWFSYLFKVN